MPLGDSLTHWSARAAAILYVVAIIQQLLARSSDKRASGRWAWTIGCVVLWVHVALAMHFVYCWDHELMIRETARQTGEFTGWAWRGGAYVNYVFMLVWVIDVIWWWSAGHQRYRRRPIWVSIIIHTFLAFIAINAVVVFAKGPVCWGGIAACVAVVAVAWRGRRRVRVAASLAEEMVR